MLRLLAPRYWGGHLALVAAILAVAWLSHWQLGAWRAERAAAAENRGSLAAVPLDQVLSADAPFTGEMLGRQVIVQGEWLPQTFFISDRQSKGTDGYWVVSPVTVASSGSAIPVVRGWSPTPSAPDLQGAADLTGWAQPGEGSNQVDTDPTDDTFPELRIASLVPRIDADLYGGFVVARTPTAGLSAVTEHDVPPVSQTTGLRNLLYGIQWWIFGGFAVFVWVRWCRDQLRPVPTPPTPTG